MKKRDPTKNLILQTIAKSRQAARNSFHIKKKQKNILRSTTNDQRRIRRSLARANKKWLDIDAPTNIDLFEHRSEVCHFVKTITKNVRGKIPVRIGFHACSTIKLSGLLYIISHIHRLRLSFGPGKITGTYPTNEKVERLLASTGVYALLKVKPRNLSIRQSNITRYIKFKSDKTPNSHEIPSLRNELLGNSLQMPSAIGRLIFRALSEAMINVNHHAYKTKHIDNHEWNGRWWMVDGGKHKREISNI